MPIDYLSYVNSVKRPLESAMQGFKIGSDFRLRNDEMAIKQQQAEAVQVELEAKKAEREQAMAMRQDLAAFSQKPEKTTEDYVAIMTKYPTLSEHFKNTFDMLSSERQKVKQNQALGIYSALDSGRNDLAESMLQTTLEAAKNSGDEETATGAEALLSLVRTNPEAAKTSAGLLLASTLGPDKLSETFKTLQEERRKSSLEEFELKKHQASLGLTDAQTKQALANVGKINAETKKAIMELEALKGSGGVDPKKRFDAEEKLRREYSTQTRGFSEVQEAYRRIGASEETAAGDLSLIFSYMKMLDPGSVVREGEFANAQNAAGVPDRILNIYNNLIDGQRLNPDQRKMFKSQAKGLFDAAAERETQVRSGLQKVIKSYGLNPDNIFLFNDPSKEPSISEHTSTSDSGATPGKSYLKYGSRK